MARAWVVVVINASTVGTLDDSDVTKPVRAQACMTPTSNRHELVIKAS
jgi:hypothetical protein